MNRTLSKLLHIIESVGLTCLPAIVACDSGDPATQQTALKAAHQFTPRHSLDTGVRAKEIQDAAMPQLQKWLGAIPEGNEAAYGFHSRSEFAQATLGTPFAMHSMKKGNPITFLDTWIVPVLVDNEFRAIVHVRKKRGELKVVSLGAKEQAVQLGIQTRAMGIPYSGGEAAILHPDRSLPDYIVCPTDRSNTHPADEITARAMRNAARGPEASTSAASADSKCVTLSEIDTVLPPN